MQIRDFGLGGRGTIARSARGCEPERRVGSEARLPGGPVRAGADRAAVDSAGGQGGAQPLDRLCVPGEEVRLASCRRSVVSNVRASAPNCTPTVMAGSGRGRISSLTLVLGG